MTGGIGQRVLIHRRLMGLVSPARHSDDLHYPWPLGRAFTIIMLDIAHV